MQEPYVSFGADVAFQITEPYGNDKDSIELPKESTRAHVRIIINDHDFVQVFIDVEGIPMMLLYLPKDVGIGCRFQGMALMSHDQLTNILEGQDELVNQCKKQMDNNSQSSHS